MTLSIGNDYDVIFLPKWRTQIWGKIDLGVHRVECEAIPKDTYLRGKRTRIWGYTRSLWKNFNRYFGRGSKDPEVDLNTFFEYLKKKIKRERW
jgi:hypothetical protein